MQFTANTHSPKVTTNIPSLAGFEFTTALARVGNNWDLLHKILLIYHRHNQSTYDNMMAAIHAENWTKAIQLSHKLKGSSATIGAEKLADIASNIEHLLKSADYITAAQCYDSLKLALIEVLESLNQLQNQSEQSANASHTQTLDASNTDIKKLITEFKELIHSDLGQAESRLNQLKTFSQQNPKTQHDFSTLVLAYENFDFTKVQLLLDDWLMKYLNLHNEGINPNDHE